MLHKEKIENGTLTYRKLVNNLRKELLKSLTLKAGRAIAKGSFSPSFTKSNDANQLELVEDKLKTKGKGK